MGFAEYSNYDGLGLAELVKKKEIKPAELVEAALERIERHNPQLNAVVFKAYDEASAMANTDLSGPFAGVPMLLKDILGFKKGWPNRDGSRFLPAVPSPFDSTLVVRFQAAGLVPLGKANVPEFGALPITEPRLYGPARNPWNPERFTGGSSSGSGAAVAAGFVLGATAVLSLSAPYVSQRKVDEAEGALSATRRDLVRTVTRRALEDAAKDRK